ncbi:hypothetical protein EST38_g8344 [Candolleomyces aberdarensis]|uniref:ATP-dependent DNA helicase n=1 Tax=Candolleomyces aberdarensis TaxID=2316362 RepID=A0A4Q2DCV5_9AGAR|nr:hypothetical protein EST38_g8344 [Candolleomyces aberdarensis]
MIASLGVPSFFITLNPADVYSPVVKFLAGADIDVDNLLPDQVPKYWDQASLVAKNPFVAAKFFNVYMKAFISHLLAYKQPTAGDFLDDSRSGIVGITKGYYGCVEAQGRGTLHCHMLVWVEGSISPNQLKAKLMEVNNDHFRDTYTRYMEDCISTSLPPLSEEGVKVPSDDHHPCSVRGVDLNNPSVDDLSAQRAKDLYNIVKHCQAHAHRATCYKYWRGPPEPKECRFGLGEAAINPASTIDPDTGEFNLRHLDGSVNNYNDTIIEATRCNCDIKGIASGDKAKAILYYITDYISKSQLKAHVAFAALESALRKLEARAPNSENTSASAHGKSLLQKCAYEMLSRQELSGQQIASYLMEYGDHYTSHTFRRLFWTSAERYIEECLPSPECNASCSSGPGEALHATGPNELPALDNDMDDAQILRATHAPQPASLDDEVVLDIDNEGTVVPRASQLRDYIYRGTMLDSVSLWNFIARVEKVKFSGGKKTLDSVKRDIGKWKDHDILQTSSVDRPRSLLSQDHDEYKLSFHSVVHPLHGYIPVPIGPALPRRDRPASHARYCRLMLTFFKPWRTASDLRGSSASWEDAFDDFRNSPACSSAVLEIMDNMQVFHECKDSRDEHFRRRLKGHKNPIPQFHNDNSTSSLNASLDDTLSSHDNADEEALLLQHLMSIQAKQSILEKARDQKVQSFLDTAADNGIVSRPNMLAYVPLLEQRQVSTSSKHIDISQSGNALEQTWQAAYRDRRKRWKMDLTKPSGAPAAAPPPIPPAQTSPNADQLQTPVVIAPSPDILQDNERLCDFVAKKWTLNESQNLAFTVAARNILEPSDEPLRMLIAGPAGTGKSRVIDALKDLFDLRKQGDRCVVASYMGIAARNVKGITIHAALNLNNLARMKLYGDTHQALIKFWEGKDTLVIDEVSMVGLQLNGQINQGLQLAKENNRPYGGINIIFAGDFAQLPPPGQTKLFASLSTSYLCAKTTGQQVIHGKLLWLSMNKVVMLSKPERQDGAANERFVELLSRLREGKCNSEDYDVLCTRVLSPDHASLFQDRSSPWKASPIIVTDNATKDALNEACAIQFALDNEQELHWYHARDLRSGKEIENVEICKLLQTYDSGKTKQRLGRIPLCIGMPVLVAQNFDVQGGVVNGSRGVVKSLRYCHDLQGRRVLTSCIVNIPNSTQEVMPGLEAHDMPIIADSVNISLQIPFTHESITIERQQVAIVPAFSMTAHRAQGQTLEHVVIDLEACNGSEAPYVMLSRATALSGVFIFRPFLRKRIMNPQSDDMLIEMHRLRMLSLETALEYGSNEQKEKAEQELLAIELQTKGRPSFTVLSTEDISKLGKSRKKIAEIVTRAQDEASHSYSLMNVDASASTVSRKRKRKQLVPDE